MPLHHLIYQSTAVRPFADDELRTLLSKARHFNADHQLTGVLLYHDGQFLQVLEGMEAELHALYERIRCDPRHTHVVKLTDAPLVQRNFGGWSMAFRPVLPSALVAPAGYLDPDALAGTAAFADATATNLLAQIMNLTFASDADQW